jgi:voltage-gated potassium channel
LIFIGLFSNFWKLCHKENLHRTILAVAALIVLGSLLFWTFEPQVSLADSVWWAIVTSTTVGYGDISPATLGGRITGVLLMVLGIGFLGILTATIAGLMVEKRILANKGLKEVEITDHYIICGWSLEGPSIIKELGADEKSRKAPVAILTALPEKPMDAPHISYVQGEVDEDTLAKAHAASARAVLMLSDDSLVPELRDAKAIMDVLTIKNLYPKLYVCVELTDPKNIGHCRLAKADEIIVIGQLSTRLMVQGALDPGIPHLVEELVSNRFGNDLYLVDLPASLAGKTFLEALTYIKQEHAALVLGISDSKGQMITNPEADRIISRKDRLVLVAARRPEFS